jgi:hypothetical protein
MKLMLFAGKWMKLENFILTKVNQAQKVKGCTFSLMCKVDLLYIYIVLCVLVYILVTERTKIVLVSPSDEAMRSRRKKENVSE